VRARAESITVSTFATAGAVMPMDLMPIEAVRTENGVGESIQNNKANPLKQFVSWQFIVGVVLFVVAETWYYWLPPAIRISAVGWFALPGAAIVLLALSDVRSK
jgi:hypothetical protein